MVEVIINGTKIDLISEGVKYTRQANDLADISTVNASYTYSLRADKTPKNTRLFEGLGLVGDTSNTPYVKNTTQLIDNGAVLITRGLATVKETNETYNLFIQDGIIDVFKLIENKTLGKDLDLSELRHNKTAQSIIDSWTNPHYRYLIADYNGRTVDNGAIDAQYQIPSVNMKYLWDKMFAYMGYTYSGDFDFLEDKWMTYPKPPEVIDEEAESFFSNISFSGKIEEYNGGWNNNYKNWNTYSPQPLEDFTIVNGWKLKVNLTGSYNINIQVKGDVEAEFMFPYGSERVLYKMNLIINGEVVDSVLSDGSFKTYSITLQADSIIELDLIPADYSELSFGTNNRQALYQKKKYSLKNFSIDYLNLYIQSKGKEEINFNSVLSEFSLRDFFKEVMIRGSLTPFPDNINRHIEFKSLKERLSTNQNNVNDLSSKFVRRTNEFYTFNTYAQRNHLRLKYNNSEENYFDGYITVENKNLEDEKSLFDSKFYAPEQVLATITLATSSEEVPLIKMWEKEIKENGGVQEIQYKPLNNRFYLLSSKWNNKSIQINTVTATGFYAASLNGTSMREVANSKYKETPKIFTDTRIHEVELLLSAYDFQSLELEKLIYIEQEAQFYVLNKVIWQSGELAIAELLRVKKETISTVNPQPQLT